jgi:hypothetical protein
MVVTALLLPVMLLLILFRLDAWEHLLFPPGQRPAPEPAATRLRVGRASP